MKNKLIFSETPCSRSNSPTASKLLPVFQVRLSAGLTLQMRTSCAPSRRSQTCDPVSAKIKPPLSPPDFYCGKSSQKAKDDEVHVSDGLAKLHEVAELMTEEELQQKAEEAKQAVVDAKNNPHK